MVAWQASVISTFFTELGGVHCHCPHSKNEQTEAQRPQATGLRLFRLQAAKLVVYKLFLYVLGSLKWLVTVTRTYSLILGPSHCWWHRSQRLPEPAEQEEAQPQ